MKSPIAVGWEKYTEHVLPGIDPNSIQFKETKKAFYSGASVVMMALDLISNSKTSEQAGQILLSMMQSEVKAFETVMCTDPRNN